MGIRPVKDFITIFITNNPWAASKFQLVPLFASVLLPCGRSYQ